MIRPAVVAGAFYPSRKEALEEMLESFLLRSLPKEKCLGLVAPHAGYIYSGAVAGAVYSRVEPPRTAVILCPNHTGRGKRLAIWMGEGWDTPMGTVMIDQPLAESIAAHCPAVGPDTAAHAGEHSAEVQLPFLQALNPDVRIVAIALATDRLNELEQLGLGIAAAIKPLADKERVLLVASSDMNHYESQAQTEAKDHLAIEKMLALDAAGLLDVVNNKGISMCGCGPAAAVISCVKDLGGTAAILRKYQTSGEVSGDFNHVVGYAGITFH